jgi:hypothetical protein
LAFTFPVFYRIDEQRSNKNPSIIMATMKDQEQLAQTGASISVMAPSDMPGGYEFFADAGNGNSYKVRVVRFLFLERLPAPETDSVQRMVLLDG